jgi:hypothetical protein
MRGNSSSKKNLHVFVEIRRENGKDAGSSIKRKISRLV